MEITLSKNKLDENDPGYQSPVDPEEVVYSFFFICFCVFCRLQAQGQGAQFSLKLQDERKTKFFAGGSSSGKMGDSPTSGRVGFLRPKGLKHLH